MGTSITDGLVGSPVAGLELAGFTIDLSDPTQMALNTTELLSAPPDLSKFPTPIFEFFVRDPEGVLGNHFAVGTITLLTPEPPQLRIDFVAVKGSFGPELVEALARGTPGDQFPHRIEDLGSVHVVL